MTMTMKMTMMMMVVVVVCVSAASLGGSRRDDMKAAGSELLTENRENVSTSVVFFRLDSHKVDNKTQDDSKTRLESHKDINETLDSTRDAPSNSSMNITTFLSEQQQNRTENDDPNETKLTPLATGASGGRVGIAAPPPCQLSICAVMNLGHKLQAGGDELAGQSSSDPYGHGK